jgi:hypothetical protein
MDVEAQLLMDECRSGTGRWRNIQDQVRIAVATLCGVISSQARQIDQLQAQVCVRDVRCGTRGTPPHSVRASFSVVSACSPRSLHHTSRC